jgi:glycosyltransferase involved in cell wall biosynthesis
MSFERPGGGAELLVLESARILRQEGYDVRIYSKKPMNHEAWQNFYGMSFADYEIKKAHQINTRIMPTSYLFLLNEWLFKHQNDADYLLDLFPDSMMYPRLPSLVYIHAEESLKPVSGQKSRVGHIFQRVAERNWKRLLGGDTIFATNSNYSAGKLNDKGLRAEVLYPPIQLDDWNCYKDPNSKAGVVSVGRFATNHPNKNHTMQMEILDGLPYKLTAFGTVGTELEAEAFKQVTNMKPGNVKLVPNAGLAEVQQGLRNARVFLHTAVAEPFGIVVVQAIAAGCLPIVYDDGGIREMVPFEELRFRTVDEAKLCLSMAMEGDFDCLLPELRDGLSRFSSEEFHRGFMRLMKQIENN